MHGTWHIRTKYTCLFVGCKCTVLGAKRLVTTPSLLYSGGSGPIFFFFLIRKPELW